MRYNKIMSNLFKITGRDSHKLANWYGKVKVADGKRKRVKLFTDKLASERRLTDLQREADQRAAGVRTLAMDFAGLSIQQHADVYLAALQLEKLDDETLRNAKWTLDKLIEWAKWQRISDVTADSMRNVLKMLDGQGKTPSYQNKFIMRAKAFIHWLQREGRIVADPLTNLKRVDERNGKKTRARRALTDAEVSALLNNAPEDRREKYAWALLAGMRRGELADLRWGDLRLNAPRPFIQLRPEQTKNGKADVLPIHPYLLNLLQQRIQGMPETAVVSTVPDMKTMGKDLKRAGIALADAHGRRADFHALRHTFCTNLDRTGCSFTTKRALMRHSDAGVTEGYSHARLDELYAAIERLPSPGSEGAPGRATMTGTYDASLGQTAPNPADHQLDQRVCIVGHPVALTGTAPPSDSEPCQSAGTSYTLASGNDLHQLASPDNDKLAQVVVGQELRPSTQVD
jgi:integrase